MKPWQKKAAAGATAAVIAASLVGAMEGTRYVPYRDVGGVATVCQGVIRGIDLHHTYTPDECAALDQRERNIAMQVVAHTIRHPVTEPQKAAATDFIYNEGAGTWDRSSMLRDFNRGDTKKACRDFLLYVCVRVPKGKGNATGPCWTSDHHMIFVNGLNVRRHEEYDLCVGKYNAPGVPALK